MYIVIQNGTSPPPPFPSTDIDHTSTALSSVFFQITISGLEQTLDVESATVGLKEGFMISLIVSPEEILIPTNGTATNWTSLRQWLDKGQATVNSLENQSSRADKPDQAGSLAAFLESWPAKPNNSKGKFLLHTLSKSFRKIEFLYKIQR